MKTNYDNNTLTLYLTGRIDIEGCEVIGGGYFLTVYRLDKAGALLTVKIFGAPAEIVEGYSMLRGIFVASRFIDADSFDASQKPMLRKCVGYLSEHGAKSLEGVF